MNDKIAQHLHFCFLITYSSVFPLLFKKYVQKYVHMFRLINAGRNARSKKLMNMKWHVLSLYYVWCRQVPIFQTQIEILACNQKKTNNSSSLIQFILLGGKGSCYYWLVFDITALRQTTNCVQTFKTFSRKYINPFFHSPIHVYLLKCMCVLRMKRLYSFQSYVEYYSDSYGTRENQINK